MSSCDQVVLNPRPTIDYNTIVGQLVMTIAAILQNIAKDQSSPSSLEFHPREQVHGKQHSGLEKVI